MTYPAFGAYGAYHGQMPMQMAVGQPVPRGVQTAVAHDGSTGYSVYSGAYAGAAVDPLWAFFSATAGQNGEVDAEELQRCLTQSGISGTYSHLMEIVILYIKEQKWQDQSDFTKDCKQRQNTGKMGYNEFKELWTALSAWKHNFMLVDQDRSGTVEFHVLTQVIVAMGYRLSPQTLIAIVKRYSKNGRISFDDYVACCVKLRALTDFFRRRDSMQQGIVNLLYDDFLQCTMTI